ncbi:MAG: hypothetical protein ACR2P8_03290 [Myxococcota bacterium]
MSRERDSPGVALVVLRRLATSTEVMLVPASGAAAGLPSAAARSGASQWTLAEELLRDSRVGEGARLYASPFTVEADEVGPLGVFVAFVNDRGDGVATGGHWMDLREACADLGPGWSGVLSGVRERFVARAPDEALRLR